MRFCSSDCSAYLSVAWSHQLKNFFHIVKLDLNYFLISIFSQHWLMIVSSADYWGNYQFSRNVVLLCCTLNWCCVFKLFSSFAIFPLLMTILLIDLEKRSDLVWVSSFWCKWFQFKWQYQFMGSFIAKIKSGKVCELLFFSNNVIIKLSPFFSLKRREGNIKQAASCFLVISGKRGRKEFTFS